MEYRELGKTGLVVSRLCFGALTIGPLQRQLSPAEGGAVISRAFAQGVNFLDTAELYGTYPHVREALKSCRKPEEMIIATKSYAYSREGMAESLEKARREMDLDVIPIFLLHEQESRHTLRGHRPALDYLLDAKAKGVVRAVGISTHFVDAVWAAGEIQEIDVISPLINVTGIGIQGGTRDEMLEAIAYAAQQGKGVYAMKPLGGGHLLSSWREALEFCLSRDELASIAVGMKSIEEVDHNVSFFRGERHIANPGNGHRKLHVDDWCVGCASCVTACPNSALDIVDGRAQVVNAESCVFCGYCGASCPEFAIKVI
ncbi:MAG TPA: 4Fe-4S binding protein [Firmicutes bacterium]|nr:MAG: aldo/keto reductase [Peptococcaceae bacterium 1109]HHT73087.1 4Fe-4S binding protein [Bacillota bacterium]